MILVVFAHVETFSIFGFTESSFIADVFKAFRMPLFFFISGFIAYNKSYNWDTKGYIEKISKKCRIQLLPTLIIGLTYTYLYLNKDIIAFINNNEKLGYWFTLSLLEIFILVYTLQWLFKSKDKSKEKSRITIALTMTSFTLLILKFIIKTVPTLKEIGNQLSLHYTFEYFIYFAFGYIMSMHKERFQKALENDNLITLSLILFCSLFYLMHFVITQNTLTGTLLCKGFEIICGFTGIIIIYNAFRKNESNFQRTTKIGCALQYIGKRTLDIYLLHYFFLPDLRQLGNFLQDGKNIIIELSLALLLAFLIVGICLLLSNLIRTSAFLRKILFGVK